MMPIKLCRSQVHKPQGMLGAVETAQPNTAGGLDTHRGSHMTIHFHHIQDQDEQKTDSKSSIQSLTHHDFIDSKFQVPTLN